MTIALLALFGLVLFLHAEAGEVHGFGARPHSRHPVRRKQRKLAARIKHMETQAMHSARYPPVREQREKVL